MENYILQQAWAQLKDIDDIKPVQSLTESLNEAKDEDVELNEFEAEEGSARGSDNDSVWVWTDEMSEEDEEDSKDYTGKVILQCKICSGLVFKDEDEIELDDENDEICNVGETCPYCQSENTGYTIEGQIVPFSFEEDDEEETKTTDDDNEDVEDADSNIDNEPEDDDFDFEECFKESCGHSKKDEGLLGLGSTLMGGGAGAAIGGAVGGPLGALAGGAIGGGLGAAASGPADAAIDSVTGAVDNISKNMDGDDVAGIASMLMASDEAEKGDIDEGSSIINEASNPTVADRANSSAAEVKSVNTGVDKTGGTTKSNNTNTNNKTDANSNKLNIDTSKVDAAGKFETGNLKSGSSGSRVVAMQELLNKAGYQVEKDGQFGPATQKALMQFQQDAGIQADGIYGPQTASAIQQHISNGLAAERAKQQKTQQQVKAGQERRNQTDVAAAEKAKAEAEAKKPADSTETDWDTKYAAAQQKKAEEEKAKAEADAAKKAEQDKQLYTAYYNSYIQQGFTPELAEENAMRDIGLG